jgi:hypothetical protein
MWDPRHLSPIGLRCLTSTAFADMLHLLHCHQNPSPAKSGVGSTAWALQPSSPGPTFQFGCEGFALGATHFCSADLAGSSTASAPAGKRARSSIQCPAQESPSFWNYAVSTLAWNSCNTRHNATVLEQINESQKPVTLKSFSHLMSRIS